MAETGVGRVIDNKYEILTSIGRGGMSYVWLGRDRRLDKMWAIKEFRPSNIGSQGAANRQAIIDEANFIKRLDHPAIPRIVDIIDTKTSIFVVMDFIDGTALNKVLRQQGGPFEQERVIEWGIQLCDVLEYLHGLEHPVVYRDMKPSNVMLRGDDTVKLIDFGISMELLPSGPSDTRVIGTGGYGAPEQVDKDVHKMVPVDTRADIYALGATLYSLVTNHVPRAYKDESGKQAIDFEMRPIREWNGQLSEGLEHILVRATQKNPADRYQTVSEMRDDLEHYEELTQEYRAIQQKKVDGFRRRLIGAGAALALGILCLIVSFVVRSSSYSNLVHEASVADKTERNEQINKETRTRTAEASESEELLTRAIEVNPGNIDTYFDLIDLYEADSLFTLTEASRWVQIWQAHGRELEGNPQYAKLCYNAGIMYLVYYDYSDAVSIDGGEAGNAAQGQAAIENMNQALRWFEETVKHGDQAIDPSSDSSADTSRQLTTADLNTAERYVAMGDFYRRVTKANREGEWAEEPFKEFWAVLEETLLGKDGQDPLIEGASPIVQLRVCQVAFEAISSQAYLTGFNRAGVSQASAEAMLKAVCDRTKSLDSFVKTNQAAAQTMYDEIVQGEAEARDNIARVYNNDFIRSAAAKDGGASQ